MGKSILVTGGAGYVGSHAVMELRDRGHAPVVIDNLQQGHREAVPTGVSFIECDLADKARLARVFAEHRFDAIMHFASNSLVGESMQKPLLYLGDNVANAVNLIEQAIKHSVRKFVLSSTANLFGNPERMPIDETARIDPGSPYGESKHIIERMLAWADTVHGLRSACLRYFNAAGAHPGGAIGEDHDPETHLIPIVLQVALGQRPHLDIYGHDYPTPDGTCVRDYVHVSDLADAHIRVLDRLDTQSCRYNLGNGRGYSVREVIDTVRRVTGVDVAVREAARRPGDPAVLVASSDAIRRDLGWAPRFAELSTIVETAWAWKKRHPKGYAGAMAKAS